MCVTKSVASFHDINADAFSKRKRLLEYKLNNNEKRATPCSFFKVKSTKNQRLNLFCGNAIVAKNSMQNDLLPQKFFDIN